VCVCVPVLHSLLMWPFNSSISALNCWLCCMSQFRLLSALLHSEIVVFLDAVGSVFCMGSILFLDCLRFVHMILEFVICKPYCHVILLFCACKNCSQLRIENRPTALPPLLTPALTLTLYLDQCVVFQSSVRPVSEVWLWHIHMQNIEVRGQKQPNRHHRFYHLFPYSVSKSVTVTELKLLTASPL